MRSPISRTSGCLPAGARNQICRPAERTGLNGNEGRAGTAAVLAALRESMSPEDYRHLVGQLPSDYAALAEPPG